MCFTDLIQGGCGSSDPTSARIMRVLMGCTVLSKWRLPDVATLCNVGDPLLLTEHSTLGKELAKGA